jgi:hypothetical protein
MKNYWLDKNTENKDFCENLEIGTSCQDVCFKNSKVEGQYICEETLNTHTSIYEEALNIHTSICSGYQNTDFITTIACSSGVGGDAIILNAAPVANNDVPYAREITLGSFTFKDAGQLGFDLFYNGTRMGWLNYLGEEALYNWLKTKLEGTQTCGDTGKLDDAMTMKEADVVKYDGKAIWPTGY